MFKFLDKCRRRIKGRPITLIEVFICVGVIFRLIISKM